MVNTISRSLGIVIMLGFICSSPMQAARDFQGGKDKKAAKEEAKRQKEERETRKREMEAATKEEKLLKKYEEIKAESLAAYQDKLNPGFRYEVDEAFREIQREHSKYAFEINTKDKSDEGVLRTGDKVILEDVLYDSPLVQDYVNRLGQSLVPPGSKYLYAFKVTLNPIPEARSLSIGTVFVSTGLLSVVDNEAQLAYILSHEIAHVENNHWLEDACISKHLERESSRKGLLERAASLGSGLLPFGAGNLLASYYLQNGLPTLLKTAFPNKTLHWAKIQEDEADRNALEYMLKRQYDANEVKVLYANIMAAAKRDPRVQLGFIARTSRIVERVSKVDAEAGGLVTALAPGATLLIGAFNVAQEKQKDQNLAEVRRDAIQLLRAEMQAHAPGKTINLKNPTNPPTISREMAAKIEELVKAGRLMASGPEFQLVFAQLKRDNGFRAFFNDMFDMARRNLEESLALRNNDPVTHYYYGRVMKQTARNYGEKKRALDAFVRSIELDQRNVLPEPRLHMAIALMENNNPDDRASIVALLKDYVEIFKSDHGGALPPDMDAIYDYLQEVEETRYAARPVLNISEQAAPALTKPQRNATSLQPQPNPESRSEPAAKAKVPKKTKKN